MASQEHLQMLDDGESTSTTSQEDDDATSSENGEVGGSAPTSIPGHIGVAEDDDDEAEFSIRIVSHEPTAVAPTKKRIKLSLGRIKAADSIASPDATKPKTQSLLKPKTKIKTPTKTKSSPPSSKQTSKLPKKKPAKPKTSTIPKLERTATAGTTTTNEDGADEIKAMIVDSDEAGEDDAIAAVVEEATPKDPTPKRRPTNHVRPLRLPSLPSPGLLIPPTSGMFRGSADANGFSTPASVFHHAMSLAGYTTEGRTMRPHRGSSVKRIVGDMFDSNVTLSLRFPKLVPKEMLEPATESKDEAEQRSQSKSKNGKLLFETLIQALKTKPQEESSSLDNEASDNGTSTRKRRKLLRFAEMVPLSLTLPYPEQYIQKRLEYVKKVEEREKAIIAFQENEEALEIANEQREDSNTDGKFEGENGSLTHGKNQIIVPPIPEPPVPPRIDEFVGIHADKFEDQHPLYPPKGKEHLVAHLDKACFDIVEGRYFGLLANSIADPHFVGPNAPGISGLNLSGGTGLATVHSGGGSSTGGVSMHAASGHTGAFGSNAAPAKSTSSSGKSAQKKASSSGSMSGSGAGDVNTGVNKKKNSGPAPTASTAELRKIVEGGGETAEQMKKSIIRAAVHASRSGKHGQSFKGSNGETYPDVSKAFAAHAGLKPCIRCKNNKQGAYHCRLRRKHKDEDYDGSNSPAILAPLFQIPLEDLLWKM